MERGAFFRAGDLITYVDSDSITPVGFNGWTGKCAVDKKRASIHSIRRDDATGDVEIVCGTLAACNDCQNTSKINQYANLLTRIEVCIVRVVIAD